MGRLDGKVAIITGGSSGIGLATARLFGEEGARVFVTGRRQVELDAAVEKIGAGVIAVQGDVTEAADLDRLYRMVKKAAGCLDVVFANAGAGTRLPLGAITEEHIADIFDVNVKGLVFTVQKALPLISEGGSIVLNASMAGSKGMPAFGVYAASKAAVRRSRLPRKDRHDEERTDRTKWLRNRRAAGRRGIHCDLYSGRCVRQRGSGHQLSRSRRRDTVDDFCKSVS